MVCESRFVGPKSPKRWSDIVSYSVFVCMRVCTYVVRNVDMGWLRLVGSLKWWVSFAEYHLFYRSLLQKRPIIWRSLLVAATPYVDCKCAFFCLSVTCLHVYRSTHSHTQTLTHTQAHTHTFTHSHTHTYTHIHTHTHTHTQMHTSMSCHELPPRQLAAGALLQGARWGRCDAAVRF